MGLAFGTPAGVHIVVVVVVAVVRVGQGADPSGVLYRFAEEMGFHDQLCTMSLGQGQGAKVR